MVLSPSQRDELDEQGFLLLPQLFSVQEVATLTARLPVLFSQSDPANIVERASGEVRTAMGLHLRDEMFARLVRHPRLLGPAQEIRGQSLYVQQAKINVKAAFSGEVWQWHYDFATHHAEDGVPHPLALNVHVFLDDVNEFNGPLYFWAGSHKFAEHRATLDATTTSYPLWVVDQALVTKLSESCPLVSATGAKGTGLIFFDTLIHGSPNNMSPWNRAIFSVIFNPVSNALTKASRADHKHHRDLAPVTPLEDNCLG